MVQHLAHKSSLRVPQTDMSNHSSSSASSLNASGHRGRIYRWKYLELIKDGLIWLTGKRTRAARSSDSLLEPSSSNVSRSINPGIQKILRFKQVSNKSRTSIRNRSRSACSRRQGKAGRGRKGRRSASCARRSRSKARGKKPKRGGFKRRSAARKSPAWKMASRKTKRGPKRSGSRPRQVKNLKKPIKRRDASKSRGASRSKPSGSKTGYLPRHAECCTKRRGKDTLVFIQPTGSKTQRGLKFGTALLADKVGSIPKCLGPKLGLVPTGPKRILKSTSPKASVTPTAAKSNLTTSCPKRSQMPSGSKGRKAAKGASMVTKSVSRRQLTRAESSVSETSSTYVATPLGTAAYLSQQ